MYGLGFRVMISTVSRSGIRVVDRYPKPHTLGCRVSLNPYIPKPQIPEPYTANALYPNKQSATSGFGVWDL